MKIDLETTKQLSKLIKNKGSRGCGSCSWGKLAIIFGGGVLNDQLTSCSKIPPNLLMKEPSQ